MKKIIITLLVIVICLAGGQCMATELVTVDAFLEKAGYSYDDINNIDAIQQFIDNHGIDVYIFEVIQPKVIQKYVDLLNAGLPISYSGLEARNAVSFDEDRSYSDIKTVTLEVQNDASIRSLVVDFDNSIVYCSAHGSIINDVGYAEKSIPLTDAAINMIANCLESANVRSMKNEYIGTVEGRIGMQLLMEFEDGISVYSVIGTDSNEPEEFRVQCNKLLTYFEQLEA